MEKSGNSATTAQIYLRNLRTIFNKAIKDGYIAQRFYPFTNYTIGISVKSKAVLFETEAYSYSEAFAGSGEMAVVRLVLEILAASKYSLILLDEPEVCCIQEHKKG